MDALAAAARRTLEEDSARVHERAFVHPPPDEGERLMTTAEGVTDFRCRRTRVERQTPGWDELFMTVRDRFPWLVGDDADDDGEEETPRENLYTDGEWLWRSEDGWSLHHERRVAPGGRSAYDPLAVIDRLAAGGEAERRGDNFAFVIPDGRERLYGDAWIDDAGRLYRVTYRWWRPQRPRTVFGRRPQQTRQQWRTLELSDFGLPVDIEVPDVEESEPDPWGIVTALGAAAVGLWRMFMRRRAFKRGAATG